MDKKPRVVSNFSKLKIGKDVEVVDNIESQIHELFSVRHPELKKDKKAFDKFFENYLKNRKIEETGVWVYYPWLKKVFHFLPEDEFFEVRTARNKPLINKKEQENFYNKTVGIVGLSVGNSVALAIAYSGGCKKFKLADPDIFELSNLNRVRVSVSHLGLNKAVVAARQIYEINPFANIEIYEKGVTHKNIEKFLLDPKIDFLIDEADDITLKFYLRLACRSLKIPLLMATDNGFNVDLDVLRFDKSSSSGGMKDAPDVEIGDIVEALKYAEPLELVPIEQVRLINKLIGINNVSYEMQVASMLKVKNKIAGWPQLAMAAFIGGSAVSFALSQISSNKLFNRDKTTINLKNTFIPRTLSSSNIKKRRAHLEKFKQFMKRYK